MTLKSTLPDTTCALALEEPDLLLVEGQVHLAYQGISTGSSLPCPEVLCMTRVMSVQGGDGLSILPAGSTQTRHIPEDTPNGFHLQSVSKLLLVISCV